MIDRRAFFLALWLVYTLVSGFVLDKALAAFGVSPELLNLVGAVLAPLNLPKLPTEPYLSPTTVIVVNVFLWLVWP